MKQDLTLETCKGCIFKIMCNEDPTIMCNAYKLIMRLRGEEFID